MHMIDVPNKTNTVIPLGGVTVSQFIPGPSDSYQIPFEFQPILMNIISYSFQFNLNDN